MLKELCARTAKNPSNSAWLSILTEEVDNVVLNMDMIEGPVRYRKGKKWKARWAVLRRVSPVADALNLGMYPDQSNARGRQKEKAFLSLEGFCGLQLLNKMDKHFNVIVIITTVEVIPLSFETIDQRAEWLAQLQDHFGKEKSFEGIVPHKQKIKSGEAVLRFYSSFFSLTRKDNYRCIGLWKLKALPKYGAVDGGFAFQDGGETHGAGGNPVIYFFSTRSGKEIHALFDSVCRAGEITQSQEAQQESSQPGPSEEESQTQPSFFKRAWLRMSGRRPRKRKEGRPRSSSMPSARHSDRRSEHRQSPPDQTNTPVLLDVKTGDDHVDSAGDVFINEAKVSKSPAPSQSPSPGYANVNPLTPEGYEIMHSETSAGRKTSDTENSARHRPEMQRKGKAENGERNLTNCKGKDEDKKEEGKDGQNGEVEGYVVIEGKDEELLKEFRTKSDAKEKRENENKQRKDQQELWSRERISQSSERYKAKPFSLEMKQNEEILENGDFGEKDVGNAIQKGKEKEKNSINEDKGLRNGQIPCRIVVTTAGEGEKETATQETILGSEEPTNPKDGEENRPKLIGESQNASNTQSSVNGDVTQVKYLAEGQSCNGSPSVSSRRGVKTPPHLLLSQTSAIDGTSAEHLYVNSPTKKADYVNVQGNRLSPNASRTRSKTTNLGAKSSGSRNKTNQYAIYDGNDDSIYHSVESLMPSHPGYQNIGADDASRSHSFENIAGHSYANVGITIPSSYKNLGASYVNVPSRPNHGNLNYVRLAGVKEHVPSPLATTSPKSAKPSSDYTWIDERKTQLLKDTARMHSDLRRENLPRVMKK